MFPRHPWFQYLKITSKMIERPQHPFESYPRDRLDWLQQKPSISPDFEPRWWRERPRRGRRITCFTLPPKLRKLERLSETSTVSKETIREARRRIIGGHRGFPPSQEVEEHGLQRWSMVESTMSLIWASVVSRAQPANSSRLFLV